MPADVALTDALLAVVAGREGFRLLYRPHGAATVGVGILLVALAAGFGAVHHAGVPGLEGTHDGVTRLAGQVGFPMVGVGYLVAAFRPQHDQQARTYSFVIFVLLGVALVGWTGWTAMAGGLAVVAVLVGAGVLGGRVLVFGGVGALGLVANELFVRRGGAVGPLSEEAWYQLGLAGACWALAQGMVWLPPDLVASADQGQN